MPPLPSSAPRPLLPRIITYYQTHHDPSGKPISLLPLLTQPSISVTHVMLAAIHLNDDPQALTLNDHPPDHPRFDTLWAELRVLQASGVRVLGMLGGAAPGSFTRLDGVRFEEYYAPLRDLVRRRALDGLDLDVEESMSLGGVVRLIDRLRADFGPGFVITLAPVAMAMLDAEKNLSGFDYEALEVLRGRDIAWYNVQFYCNWGDASNTYMYDLMLGKGWPPEKIVIGLVTNPANGAGFVPWHMLSVVLALLKRRHQQFGGVMGWEYFNGLPGGAERPWEWARDMTSVLRREALAPPPNQPPPHEPAEPPPIPPRPSASTTAPVREVEADPDDVKGGAAVVPSPFDYYSDESRDD
ncbi:Chitinase [Purpureocillium takamizusanense]|uniref:chitinase n=1 Tax=Purpureocillium takamizusanense TaxID=2060973 RepID=A0A9Q8QG34_9HYPO|nr:Chitinase [Purpureocillium takamizusanense]UNI18612.1 Chitinase [Purpureocillium takamizusanense]